MSQSYHDVMDVYKRPMSVRYIPSIFWAFVSVISLSLAFPTITQAYEAEPVIWVQVPQWTDDWAVCSSRYSRRKHVIGMLQTQTIHLVKVSIGRQHLGLMLMV